ncbi:hypothetical protein V2J09_019222 [Rumex salicifolius]
MDSLEENSLSWLADIRQKLEVICMEVEKTINCSTLLYINLIILKELNAYFCAISFVKLVENQVQSATNTLKNFYSHAIEDILPDHDPAIPEYPALGCMHNFYPGSCDKAEMVITRNHQVKIASEKMAGDSRLASDSDARGSGNSSEELITNESEAKLYSFALRPVRTETPTVAASIKLESASLCKDDDHTPSECKMCNEKVLPSETVDSTEASLTPSASSPAPIIFDESWNDGEMSDKSDAGDDEIESDADDKEELDVQVSEQELDDESCVLVDKSEQFSTVKIQGKQRSYKKIREMLKLRRWSNNQNQVHQQTDSSRQESAKILDSASTNLQSDDSIDSDWEIL